MKTLLDKINDILIKENYTFKQLADFLNITEEALEKGLINKTLEIRHFEEISKNLKVPLYSIFRDPNEKNNLSEKPFFVNKLWDDDEDSSPQKLQGEINILKRALTTKEKELTSILK